jgi:hypothetical protein
MISTIVIVGIVVGGLSGVIGLALILRFLWLVYDRGGSPHLMAAAAALRSISAVRGQRGPRGRRPTWTRWL